MIICDILGYQNCSQKNVWGVKSLELHQIEHKTLCGFSEISPAPVCAIINDLSLMSLLRLSKSVAESLSLYIITGILFKIIHQGIMKRVMLDTTTFISKNYRFYLDHRRFACTLFLYLDLKSK